MQTIQLDPDSPLAEAIMGQHLPNIFISVQNDGGEKLYRGVIDKWSVTDQTLTVSTDQTLTVSLADWNEYWGELAARKFWI